jgi:hypothetical protein
VRGVRGYLPHRVRQGAVVEGGPPYQSLKRKKVVVILLGGLDGFLGAGAGEKAQEQEKA